jgi:hyperosmotically inducible protein
MKKSNKFAIGILTTVTLSSYSFAFAGTTANSNNSAGTTNSSVTTTQKYISDATITAQVKVAFLKSKILNPLDIKVTTKSGIVFLSGVVDTDTQYSEAVASAQATDGVKDVNVDNLTVKDSKAPLQDTYITAKIKGSYMKASVAGPDVSFVNTHVETKNGVVYLSGTLDNTQQINNAIKIAKSIDGVKDVKSSLTVE